MVNYIDVVNDEIEEAKENQSSGSDERETLDQIEVDMQSTPFVKFYPTVALTGTIPEGEGNPIIRFRDEANNGHGHHGYLGVVVDDLTVDQSDDGGFDMTEAYIVETDDDDYTEYRVVNFNDEKTTSKFDGEAVSVDGDQYGVEDKMTTIEGRSILVVDRTAARAAARKLDVDGATPAGMDEGTGQPNTGLIEYAPRDEDTEVSWRYARNPEMREELLGTDVTFLVSRREEVDSEPTGYIGENGQHDEPVVGFGEDEETHTDPTKASYLELTEAVTAGGSPEARGMMWYTIIDEDGQPLEPIEGEATGYSYLEWRFDKTAGHLPEDQWNFVEWYQKQDAPDDEETILAEIRENLGGDANEERIVGLIQSGAGQE